MDNWMAPRAFIGRHMRLLLEWKVARRSVNV